MSNLATYNEKTFEQVKEKMISLMQKEEVQKEISFAIQALAANEYLAKAEQTSVLKAVYNTATTGLSLNPVLKFAALVPRFQNGKVIACLEPMYQGLVKLITDTGSVKTIYAYNVCEGDEFEVVYGTTAEIVHKPKFKSKSITHTYAVAILPDGTKQFEVMTKEELDHIRGLSESYKAYEAKKVKQCIWVTHEGEMCKKTVVKRLVKYLPKTDKYSKLAETIELDNQDYEASESQRYMIESLLEHGGKQIDEEETKAIRLELCGNVSTERASEIISFLKDETFTFQFK